MRLALLVLVDAVKAHVMTGTPGEDEALLELAKLKRCRSSIGGVSWPYAWQDNAQFVKCLMLANHLSASRNCR